MDTGGCIGIERAKGRALGSSAFSLFLFWGRF